MGEISFNYIVIIILSKNFHMFSKNMILIKLTYGSDVYKKFP